MAQHLARRCRQRAVRPHLIADLASHALYERVIECRALRMMCVGWESEWRARQVGHAVCRAAAARRRQHVVRCSVQLMAGKSRQAKRALTAAVATGCPQLLTMTMFCG